MADLLLTIDRHELDIAQQALDINGFCRVRSCLDGAQVTSIIDATEQALKPSCVAVRRRNQAVYAARNFAQLWPQVSGLLGDSGLRPLVASVLGPEFGLVRAILFDKPPARSWTLTWHQDLTIAVAEQGVADEEFSHPTVKAGVPHLEAPARVLEAMLTLRLHLDAVNHANGPLRVVPGSHRNGKLGIDVMSQSAHQRCVEIHVEPGDVLLMRPLIVHSSPRSEQESASHRRVIHLEFAPIGLLPSAFRWHMYLPQ